MKCRLPFLAILIFNIQSSFAQTTEKWTLEKCIEYAIQNNVSVRQAALNAGITGNQNLQSKLNMLPNFDFNAGYNLNFGNSLNPSTYTFEQGNSQIASLSVQGNLTLFNGLQQINGVRKTNYDLLASKFDYENAKNNVALNVASGYLQILLNREIVGVDEKQEALTAEQRAIVEDKIKAGASPETAIYDMDAQLSRDEATLVNAKGTYDISVLSLKQLLALTDEQPFDIDTPNVDADNVAGIADLTSAGIYKYAVLNQPSIQSAEAKLKSADIAVQIQKGYITPTLSAFYNYSTAYTSNGVTPVGTDTVFGFVVPEYKTEGFAAQLKSDARQVAGLTLYFPIFGKASRFINISTSKLQRQINSWNLIDAKLQLRQSIEQAYANAKAAAESYQANKKSLVSSQKAYDATEVRYRAGAATNFDIQQAKENLIAAESQMIQAKYTYVFRLKILDFYQGKPITLKNQ